MLTFGTLAVPLPWVMTARIEAILLATVWNMQLKYEYEKLEIRELEKRGEEVYLDISSAALQELLQSRASHSPTGVSLSQVSMLSFCHIWSRRCSRSTIMEKT